MTQEEPLINERLLLERFPGKGGWTFVRIPDIPLKKKNHFGWQKVRGVIVGYEVPQLHLIPMGKGKLFTAVKAAIRKIIKKEEGDWVDVLLYPLDPPLPVPADFELCLQDEPQAMLNFEKLSEEAKKECIDWIYALKSETAIVDRMASAINNLVAGFPVIPSKH